MLISQGHGAGLSSSKKLVLGPTRYQGLRDSLAEVLVCKEALLPVLSIITEWPGRVQYSGIAQGSRLLASTGMMGAL